MREGFTLAEVLITLGVIGVVAAMTIPNLNQNNFEKKVVSQLRETQSILAQAIRMAEEEYGDVTGWGIETSNKASAILIANNLKPFLKIATDCGTSDTKEACLPKTNYKSLNNTGSTINYNTSTNYYKIKLLNGSSIWWRGGSTAEMAMDEYIDFWIDINGTARPNILGKDLFVFIYEKNSIKAEGAPNTESENTCTNLQSIGWGCAYVVLNNNNMNYLHK